MLSMLVGGAMAATPYRPLGRANPPVSQPVCTKEYKVTGESQNAGIPNLPFAMGKKFATLDEYLAYLECFAGPIDKPWWREIRPGVYEHVTTATNAKHEIATRAELEKRFGFSK